MKILETVPTVTQTKTNVALLAILDCYLFYKNNSLVFFTKFGPMMDTNIADVTDKCRY